MPKQHKRHKHRITCKICKKPVGDKSRKNVHKGCAELAKFKEKQ